MYHEPKTSSLTASDRPNTEIDGCLSRASNALDRLNNRLNTIEDRPQPVMRATGVGGQASTAGVPQEALSPLGDSIRSIESRIDNACDRLESLLNGLAL